MKGYIPRSIVLNVVFLDLLDVVIALWIVHSFGTTEVRKCLREVM